MVRRIFGGVAVLFLMMMATGMIGCKDNGVDPYQPSPSPPPSPPPSGGSGTVSFQAAVLPILQNHGCTGCHGGTKNLFAGSVPQLLAGGTSGPAVVAGNAGGSLLIKKVSSAPPFGARMPLGGPYLSGAEIQTITDWINQGAKDN